MRGKLGTQLADVKLWRKDLADAADSIASMEPQAFQQWLVGQLRDNLAPLLEAEVRALDHEIGEVRDEVEEVCNTIDEIIGQAESFLQPEVGAQFAETINVGLAVCELAQAIPVTDELTKAKLDKLIGAYQQLAIASLDEIEQIMADDDEEEDDDADEGSRLHEEGGHAQGPHAGGARAPGEDGSDGSGTGDEGKGGE